LPLAIFSQVPTGGGVRCRAAGGSRGSRRIRGLSASGPPLAALDPARCGSGGHSARWIGHALAASGLSDQVMSHMKPYTLAAITPVPAAQLRAVIGRAGVALNDDRIRVTYAANCTIEQRTAAHLVVQSRHGIVTVFLLMPRVGGDAARSFRDNGWIGRIEPFGTGSIALIALQTSALEEVSARLRVVVVSVDGP
jgi:Protein of unknown function (DUF3379)